jgi:hypothetical protein
MTSFLPSSVFPSDGKVDQLRRLRFQLHEVTGHERDQTSLMIDVLKCYRDSECSNPRDRIYGVLGLFERDRLCLVPIDCSVDTRTYAFAVTNGLVFGKGERII